MPDPSLLLFDVRVEPIAHASRIVLSFRTAHSFTLLSLSTAQAIRHSANCDRSDARLVKRDKLRDLERTVRAAVSIRDLAEAHMLGFILTPLALDIFAVSALDMKKTNEKDLMIISLCLISISALQRVLLLAKIQFRFEF